MRSALTAVTLAVVSAVGAAACGSGGSHAAGTSTTSGSTSTAAAGGCHAPHRPATVAYRRVPGSPANSTSLDIHPPTTGCDHPVVIWVHGGGYQIGDKRNAITDKVRWANDHDWVLVSVNYRLTKSGDPGSAHYPDHFEDVAASIAWVHTNIASYGGDPDRLALMGHSAGADIVANVLVDPTYLHDHGLPLQAISCGAPLDTEGFDKVRAAPSAQPQWKAALGNLPDYRTRTSATRNVRSGIGIPLMIGVVRGSPRRRAIEHDFLQTLRDHAIDATEIEARSLTHQQVNRSIGAPGDQVMTPPLTTFLSSCFR